MKLTPEFMLACIREPKTMKPFNTAIEAQQWIRENAIGSCEVYVWNTNLIMGIDENGKFF